MTPHEHGQCSYKNSLRHGQTCKNVHRRANSLSSKYTQMSSQFFVVFVNLFLTLIYTRIRETASTKELVSTSFVTFYISVN